MAGNTTDALALYEEHDVGRDVTYIYWRDGWLCELYAGADDTPDPDMGERIIQTEGFSVSQNGSLLTIDAGRRDAICYAARGSVRVLAISVASLSSRAWI